MAFSAIRKLENSWNEHRPVQVGRAGQVLCTCTSIVVQQVLGVV